jgi:hypothetical protein
VAGGSGFAQELERRLKGRELADRKLILLGLINKFLPKNERAVLVGGSLVQFYSAGAYESLDIDTVVSSRDAVARLMREAGFREDTRGFEDAGSGLVLDLSTKPLRPTEEVIDVRFEDLTVPMLSIEDAIVDRLLAAKYWRSAVDFEQAFLLYAVVPGRVREKVLLERAERNDVEDTLAAIRAKADEVGRSGTGRI